MGLTQLASMPGANGAGVHCHPPATWRNWGRHRTVTSADDFICLVVHRR